MWSTDESVGPSPLMIEKRINANVAPTVAKSFLGLNLTLAVGGIVDITTTITTNSGFVDATIPFKAEMVLDDEINLGQSFSFDVSLLTPDTDPVMSGMTPSGDVNLLLEFDRFEVLTSFSDFGPYTGSNTGDERLQFGLSQPWQAVLQLDGSLATAGTVSTTLGS